MTTAHAQSCFESYLSGIKSPLLGKKGETTLAKEIAELEVAAWSLLLAYAPAKKIVAKALSGEGLSYDSSASVVREADHTRVLFNSTVAAVDARFTKKKGWTTRRRAIADIEDRAQRARHKFVRANLRLVVKISTKFKGRGLSPEDLVQEGNIGLIQAIDRYDYRRGFRFSTYGTWWIRHSIQRALLNTGRTVRWPVHIQEAIQKVARAQNRITADRRRPATDEEVAEMVGVPVAKVRSIKTQITTSATVPFDSTEEEDVGATIGLTLDEPSPLDSLIQKQETGRVEALLRTLKPIQATILRKRFGIGEFEPTTLGVIGKQHNLSRERIRQLQNEALDLLRSRL